MIHHTAKTLVCVRHGVGTPPPPRILARGAFVRCLSRLSVNISALALSLAYVGSPHVEPPAGLPFLFELIRSPYGAVHVRAAPRHAASRGPSIASRGGWIRTLYASDVLSGQSGNWLCNEMRRTVASARP